METVAIVSVLSFAAWLYLAGLHGRFWRSTPAIPHRAPSGEACVAVVVPARNEAANICRSLESLLAQDYPGELSIVLVDDDSTDGTSQIAASLAASRRLTILRGEPLPMGWTGKMWAVHQGLAH
ncbi:MAG TPA: glycosyltransferase, partial [Terracidiphilus sp.]|nr:glycosyltransferase [Terracidiphilus sp.]